MALPNILLILCLTYKFAEGYFINYDLEEPIVYESRSLHSMRIVALFFGFIYLLIFVFLCCLLCCFIVVQKKDSQNRMSLLQRIKAIPYGNLVFQEGRECAICITGFKSDDQIIQLNCHELHIYHKDCIEEWIKKGNLKCPLCRQDITSET